MCEPVATAASSGSSPSLHKASQDKMVSVVSKLQLCTHAATKIENVMILRASQISERNNYKCKLWD